MHLPNLLVASVAAFFVLHFFLIPRAKERWRAERTPAVVARAATLALLRQLRAFAILALVALALVYVAFGLGLAIRPLLHRRT